MTDQRKPNIGPQELEAVKDLPFLLSMGEWYSIQRYVTNAMQLPGTEEKMRRSFGKYEKGVLVPYGGRFDDFKELLAGYQTILPHVFQWHDQTFPATVSLAADIAHYNTKVPAYYGAIKTVTAGLMDNPNDETAKKRLTAIINSLAKDAETFGEKARKAHEDIKAFAQDTDKDRVLIDGLARAYEQKFGAGNKDLQAAIARIQEIHDELSSLNKEYEHNVVVAATSPTYAWVFPFGTIAAAIVAGIFGDKAVKTKQKIETAQAELARYDATVRTATVSVATLNMAKTGLHNLAKDIAAALPAIQKMQSVWYAIKGDLTHIGTLINEDIDKAILEIKDLGVDAAIEAWKQTALKADAYRAHAFITIEGEIKEAA